MKTEPMLVRELAKKLKATNSELVAFIAKRYPSLKIDKPSLHHGKKLSERDVERISVAWQKPKQPKRTTAKKESSPREREKSFVPKALPKDFLEKAPPLHLACYSGTATFSLISSILSKRNANVNERFGSGRWTALHVLAYCGGHGAEGIARLLLERGIDASSRTSDGWTAAELAVYFQRSWLKELVAKSEEAKEEVSREETKKSGTKPSPEATKHVSAPERVPAEKSETPPPSKPAATPPPPITPKVAPPPVRVTPPPKPKFLVSAPANPPQVKTSNVLGQAARSAHFPKSPLPTIRTLTFATSSELSLRRYKVPLTAQRKIPNGEDGANEFKPWTTKAKSRFDYYYRTIAAFLNSPNGGTLWIGIADDATFLGCRGLAASHDRDVFERQIRTAVDNRMFIGPSNLLKNSKLLAKNLKITFSLDQPKEIAPICRIRVEPFFDDLVRISVSGKYKVFMRDGNQTVELRGDDIKRLRQNREQERIAYEERKKSHSKKKGL